MRLHAIAFLLGCLLVGEARGGDFTLVSPTLDPSSRPIPGEQPPPSSYEDSGNKLHCITMYAMLGIVAGLIVYDVVLSLMHESTESQIISDYAWRHSTIPFLLGVLIGHWLFNHGSEWNMNMWPYGLVALGAVITFDILKKDDPDSNHHWTRYPGIWFGLGLPVGALLWSQRHP